MKFSVKLIAAALCAAMLCVPTLAAGSSDAPGAGTYVPDPQYTMAWGTATWQDNGSLLVRKSGENKPTDGMALWTKNAIVLDAVSAPSCALRPLLPMVCMACTTASMTQGGLRRVVAALSR